MYENYEFIKTKGLNNIDLHSNVIYYTYDYYKKWWIDNYPDKQFYKDSYFSFIHLKRGEYSGWNDALKFRPAIKNFVNNLDGEWIICTVPGHEATENLFNPVFNLVSSCEFATKVIYRNTLIQRAYTVETKHGSTAGRVMDPNVEMKSLVLENHNIKNKNILVIDDITTTGTSLIACKTLLLRAGAKNVVCLALGKTREPMYGY